MGRRVGVTQQQQRAQMTTGTSKAAAADGGGEGRPGVTKASPLLFGGGEYGGVGQSGLELTIRASLDVFFHFRCFYGSGHSSGRQSRTPHMHKCVPAGMEWHCVCKTMSVH